MRLNKKIQSPRNPDISQAAKRQLPNICAIILLSIMVSVAVLFLSRYGVRDIEEEDANTAGLPSQLGNRSGGIQVGEYEQINLHLTYTSSVDRLKVIRYPHASYIKVHISQIDLMPGDVLTVSDPDGTQIFTYPGSAYTTDESNGFWPISILGDTAVIEIKSAQSGDISIPPQYEDVYRRAVSGVSREHLGVVIDKFARGYPEEEIQSLLYGTESTCGSNERTDVVCYENSHPTEFEKSHAVARLLKSGIWLCTGWRASDQNRLFTNEHCITSQSELDATEMRFNYQNMQCGVTDPAPTTVVTGDQFLIDNYNYDFALVTVNNFETITSFGYLEIDPRTPVLNEEIYIPQHGNGNPKEFGIESDMNTGNVCRIDNVVQDGVVPDSDTGYFCDTIGGSSGSPVLARSNHQVIALHHYGTGGAACNSSTMNGGVRMDLIWPLVETYFDAPDIGPLVYDSHTIDDDNTGDSSGNSDGAAQCGESIELFVDLLNQGTDSASGVQAAISTTDSYVTWLENTTSSYPDIPGGGTRTNNDDYDLSLSPSTPDGHVITFDLDITASSGGPWTDSFDITVDCSAPAAPTNLTVTPVSGTEIDLTWQDNADDESAYYIEQSSNGTSAWAVIDTVAANTTSFRDTSLNCDTEYFYRVRAYRSDTGKYSGYSSVENTYTYACKLITVYSGWNLVTLPLEPVTEYTAQSLLDEINGQGNTCSEVNRWLSDSWDSHSDGSATTDFDINLGDGYLIKCSVPGQWSLSGTTLSTGVILNLTSGWNLVGIPYPETGYEADSLLSDINSQAGTCSEINRWVNSGWEAHLDGLLFNNFPITTTEAYFIICSGSSTFTPGP